LPPVCLCRLLVLSYFIIVHKALAIREKALGKEHPDTIATYENIAEVYKHQGDEQQALEWPQKAQGNNNPPQP
jgi:tetratricopeptide (TPR) repeat protein